MNTAVGDRPQQLVVSGVWDIPIFKNGSKWEGRFLGGWQVSGTYTAALGSWLTPGSYGISYVGSRPNYLCDPNLARSQRTITAHSKVSCLANPAPGQMGNAGTGTVQGSGINLWNSGFMKKFQVRERHVFAISRRILQPFQPPAVR